MKQLAIAAVIALTSLGAQADDLRPLRFVLGGGLTFGGETLANVTYSDGSDQNIRSGGLLEYHAGIDVRATPHLSFQATLGYHVDTSAGASNGSVRFSRVPAEVLGYFHVSDNLRLGGGVRMVFSPELKGRGVASNVNQKFDNTTGAILEGEYLFTRWFGLKLRAVSETYRASDTGIKANGDHVGVYVNFYL